MDRQARYKPQAENDFLPMAETIGRFLQYSGRGDYFSQSESSLKISMTIRWGTRCTSLARIWMALLFKKCLLRFRMN